MKKRLAVGVAVAFVCGGGFVAGTAHADPPSCNWGELTADSIAAGFPQGAHSSDPSGDGHGPGTVDEPRDGLANVVGKGDLEATCIVIESLLP
jgi:hypothetical protein